MQTKVPRLAILSLGLSTNCEATPDKSTSGETFVFATDILTYFLHLSNAPQFMLKMIDAEDRPPHRVSVGILKMESEPAGLHSALSAAVRLKDPQNVINHVIQICTF